MKLLVNDNGALELIYTGAAASKNKTVLPTGLTERLNNNKGIRIEVHQGGAVDILLSLVTETQIGDSGTPVAFSGSISDLEDFINANFFFDLAAGEAYPPNTWQAFENAYATRNTAALLTNTLYGRIINIKGPFKVEMANLRITAGAVGNAVVGLYKYNLISDSWNLVAQTDPSTPFDLNIVAPNQMASFTTSYTAMKGRYAICILANIGATIYHLREQSSSTDFGESITISTTDYRSGVSAAVTYSTTLPASPTFTLASTASLPYIQLGDNL